MRSKLYRALRFAIVFAAASGATTHAPAQALPTVDRHSEFAAFAQGTMLRPDWGQTNNYGYSLGLDYTHFFGKFVQPGLELRFTRATGRTVNENTYLGGLKLQTTIHAIHPYALILAGKGIIKFNYNNAGVTADNSLVYGLGGGVELAVTRLVRIRADFISQHWDLQPNTLTPATLNLGIAYTLPFHGRSAR
jgi:hypothetical protein